MRIMQTTAADAPHGRRRAMSVVHCVRFVRTLPRSLGSRL